MADVSTVTNGFFVTAKEGFTTTTSGSVASAAGTVGLNSVSGYSNGEHVALVIDPTDATKKQVFTGTVDTAGVQITSVVWTEGDNQSHTAGATVVDYETATAWALQKKGWDVEHKQDGTHDDITATSITVAGNIDVTDGAAIRDANDNEIVVFQQTASAVNQVDITNAATSNAPSIAATGGDTNIPLNLATKGTGLFQFNGAYKSPLEIGRTTLVAAGDTITVSSLPARKYLRIIVNLIPTGTTDAVLRFNNDSGANYAQRHSADFGAATTQVSQTHLFIDNGTPTMPSLIHAEVINNSSNEKLVLIQQISAASGAANAPSSLDAFGKWANTAAQINRVDVVNVQTGDFAIGSEVVVWGWD